MFDLRECDPYKYKSVLEHYGFDTYPRLVGLYQHVALDFEDVWKEVQRNNTSISVFVSHNQYRRIEFIDGRHQPTIINYSLMFFDFDSKKSENAQHDAQRLHRALSDIGLAHFVTFTGNGFHLYIIMEPENWVYDLGEHKRAFKAVIHTVQQYFRRKLRLRTLDCSVMAEPKKLTRLLYTRHAHGNKPDQYNHIPLTEAELYSSIESIRYISESCELVPKPIFEGKRYKLSEIVSALGLALTPISDTINTEVNTRKHFESDLEAILTIIEHGRYSKPCVLNDLMSSNPRHCTRVYFATLCRRLGKSVEDVDALWMELAAKNMYVDAYNAVGRLEQIRSIFDGNYVYLHSCDTLKNCGICIGERCRRYRG